MRLIATDLVVVRFHLARTLIESTRHFEYSQLCIIYPLPGTCSALCRVRSTDVDEWLVWRDERA
jgi:hypothetical protein